MAKSHRTVFNEIDKTQTEIFGTTQTFKYIT